MSSTVRREAAAAVGQWWSPVRCLAAALKPPTSVTFHLVGESSVICRSVSATGSGRAWANATSTSARSTLSLLVALSPPRSNQSAYVLFLLTVLGVSVAMIIIILAYMIRALM